MDHQVILDVYVCASYNIHNFVQVDEGESGMSELLRNACKKHEAQNCIISKLISACCSRYGHILLVRKVKTVSTYYLLQYQTFRIICVSLIFNKYSCFSL